MHQFPFENLLTNFEFSPEFILSWTELGTEVRTVQSSLATTWNEEEGQLLFLKNPNRARQTR